MDYSIHYYSKDVEAEILALPDTLAARYIVLTTRMITLGPNLGEPHTKAFGAGLFEIRLKGKEGIARVFYCTQVERQIHMLHSFIKKSQNTPETELETARTRMKEIKDGNAPRDRKKTDETPRGESGSGANRKRRRRST
jgi:phage-related protein